MNVNQFKEELFHEGKLNGFTDMEIYVTKEKSFNVKVFQAEVDDYSLSNIIGLGFRGKFNDKMGYAYTEVLDQESIAMLINKAQENATVIESDDDIEIFSGSDNYPTVKTYADDLSAVTVEQKIDFAKGLEEYALKMDQRVTSVNYAIFIDSDEEVHIANTMGLEKYYISNNALSYVMVVVKDKDDVKTAGAYLVSNCWSDFDAEKLAYEAVTEAISLLGAESVPSKNYPVILRNDVAGDVLGKFSSVFSAEIVHKGLSLLADLLGEKIASEIVTILDDPLLENGSGSRPFDGEGVPTRNKVVVDCGKLSTFLHNLKTAKKDGVDSTGNAQKSSFRSPVGVGPTNFYIQPGELEFSDMLSKVEDGIVVIDVQGLHSGANSVSGDFSLGAYGYHVKGGVIVSTVEQITIAGNFFDLLKNIEIVGSDLKFGMSSGQGCIGSPSLLIKSLAISGK